MTTYKVVRNYVVHHGKLVGPGETLELSEQKARSLLTFGQIVAVESPAPAAEDAAEAPEEEAMTLPDATPEPIKPPAQNRK